MVLKCMESPNLFLIIRIKSPSFSCQYCMESPNLIASMFLAVFSLKRKKFESLQSEKKIIWQDANVDSYILVD